MKDYEAERAFYNEIPYGRQYDVIEEMSQAQRQIFEADFSDLTPLTETEYFEKILKMSDEWKDKRNKEYRENNPISDACKNLLVAIKKRYIKVALIKSATNKMNSRERQIIWATWKGFAHAVYYPKG